MGKVTPKRCPNCGSTNIHIQELESPHDWEEWYDVYCRDCGWSGDISADLPANKGKKETE
jgi:predicted nucleic-acid-binding Zn-ribbon protein